MINQADHIYCIESLRYILGPCLKCGKNAAYHGIDHDKWVSKEITQEQKDALNKALGRE